MFTPKIARGVDLMTMPIGPEVPAGLPDLLARRPDVSQAEANLVLPVNEARAQYYPSLLLTGRFGSESSDLSDLFSGPALVWSIAASLLQPIIDGGRIGAQVDAATARRAQAEIDYVRTVQSAFRDTHDALVAHSSARASFFAQEERRARLIEAYNLADLRNRSGYTGYLDVLATEQICWMPSKRVSSRCATGKLRWLICTRQSAAAGRRTCSRRPVAPPRAERATPKQLPSFHRWARRASTSCARYRAARR